MLLDIADHLKGPEVQTKQELQLIEAIKNGDREQLEKILESSDLKQLLEWRIKNPKPTNHAIGHDATPLQFASYRKWKGDETVSMLLAGSGEVDLHSACGLGKIARIAEILKADPLAFNQQVDTYFPVQYAISASQPASIEALMLHGDDPNRDLKKVAYFGWEDEVQDQDYTPWKPIHMASLYGFDATRIPVAECLLKSGADIDAVSPLDGFRPIHLVAMPNRVDMIRFFVSSGADVDSRTVKGNSFKSSSSENDGPIPRGSVDCTPLMVACAEGWLEASDCLLELGADINAKNSLGQTPLDLAAKRHWNGQPYDALIELLISRGAKKSD